MSDRAPGQIVIYACPEDERGPLIAALEAIEFWEDFGLGQIGAPLKFNTVYGQDQAQMDAYETAAEEAMRAAPGASFATWTDPLYEYDGMAVLHTPELGDYVGRCNAAGEIYLTAAEIRAGLQAGDLESSAGLAWFARLDELREANLVHGS